MAFSVKHPLIQVDYSWISLRYVCVFQDFGKEERRDQIIHVSSERHVNIMNASKRFRCARGIVDCLEYLP